MHIAPDWVQRRQKAVPKEYIDEFGPLLGRLLWSRGMTDIHEARNFLNPKLENLKTPMCMKNMRSSVIRLAQAIENGEKIAVYADYDMDGMSGLALLVTFLEEISRNEVVPYQPDRFAEGYGVHPAALEELAEKGVKLVLTVDTGITAFDAATKAKELDLALIITDHHQQLGDKLPDTPYIINPNQKACESGLGYLSGVGVAFYLCVALRALLREQGYFRDEFSEPDLRKWLDLYVLGTVADSVDLVGDNRSLVRAGLKQLLNSQRPGLRALMDRVLPGTEFLSARDLAFSVAPKLNAASRMGKAHLATELLLTRDKQRAWQLAEELVELNTQRGKIQSAVYNEALEQAKQQLLEDEKTPVIVVHGDWHEGVLGVVAAKLVERFKKPSIVLTRVQENEMLRGSMRTLNPVSCVKALDACKDLLHRYGGHKMAAGLQMKAQHAADFCRRVSESTGEFLTSLSFTPSIEFDCDLPEDCLDAWSVESLESTSPWGAGNPEPLFRIKNLDLSTVEVLKGQHLRCQILKGVTLIGFFKSEDLERLKKLGTRYFDALVTPEINRFRNQKNVQLRLHYVRPSENTSEVSEDAPEP